MSTNPLRLAVIIASVREGRFGPVVASWFAAQAALHDRFEIDVIDLAEAEIRLPLPAVSPRLEPNPERPAGMRDLTERLAAADAFVIVTPEYNRSFPAALKAVIDWHFTQWERKAIAFVGYSGLSGGLLAIEQLRQIFNELDAHTVREYVSFPATTCCSTRTDNCARPRNRPPRHRTCWTGCTGGRRPWSPRAR